MKKPTTILAQKNRNITLDLLARQKSDLSELQFASNKDIGKYKSSMAETKENILSGLPSADRDNMAKKIDGITSAALGRMQRQIELTAENTEVSQMFGTIDALSNNLMHSAFQYNGDGVAVDPNAASLMEMAEVGQGLGYLSPDAGEAMQAEAAAVGEVSKVANHFYKVMNDNPDKELLEVVADVPADVPDEITEYARDGFIAEMAKSEDDGSEEVMAEQTENYSVALMSQYLIGNADEAQVQEAWDTAQAGGQIDGFYLAEGSESVPSLIQSLSAENMPDTAEDTEKMADAYYMLGSGELSPADVAQQVIDKEPLPNPYLMAQVAAMPSLVNNPTFKRYNERLLQDFADSNYLGFKPQERFLSAMLTLAQDDEWETSTAQQIREVVHAAYGDAEDYGKATLEANNEIIKRLMTIKEKDVISDDDATFVQSLMEDMT